MPKYLIRLDDACQQANWPNWHRIENILNLYGIKPIVAVIPDNKDPNLKYIDKGHEKLFTRLIIQLLIIYKKLANNIIYNSYRSKESHEKIGLRKIKSCIIYNGYESTKINDKFSDEIKSKLQVNKQSIIIGMVANFRSFKDHENCIEAFNIIRKKRPNVFLCFNRYGY